MISDVQWEEAGAAALEAGAAWTSFDRDWVGMWTGGIWGTNGIEKCWPLGVSIPRPGCMKRRGEYCAGWKEPKEETGGSAAAEEAVAGAVEATADGPDEGDAGFDIGAGDLLRSAPAAAVS
jgi:hypothetical protein